MTVSPGKVEIGQGIVTALAQIAADELDVDIGRVRNDPRLDGGSPNEGVTSGSLSVQQSGRAIRQACAEIRQIFLGAASDRLGVGIDALGIEDGTISGPGNVQTSYWELAEQVSLDRDATPGAMPKVVRAARAGGKFGSAAGYSRQGFRASALHSRCRAAGDAAWPRAATGNAGGEARRINRTDAAHAVAGLVAIVRDGNFAGVVSETEDAAEAALKALRKGATWSSDETLPDENRLASFLKAQPSEPTVIDTRKASSHRRNETHDPAAIYPPLYRACLDRAILRDGAVDRGGSRPCLDPQPGSLSAPRRSRAGAEIAGREYHGRAYGGRRLLRA